MYSSLVGFINKKFNTDAHYFFHGGFWLTVTQVVVVSSGLVTTALFAQYLSPTEYGMYRYLIGLAVIFSSFSLTGLGQSILQTAAKKYYSFYTETIKINLAYSLGIAVVAMGGALYYWYFNNPILSIGCLIIALLQPIINIYQFIPTFLQGSKRFKESTIIQSIRIIIVSITSLAVLYFTKNILFLLSAYIGSSALINIASHFWYRHRSQDITPPEILKKYIDYARHTSLRNIISTMVQRADIIIIFTQLGAADVALYTIAMIIPEQVKASFKNLASLLLPKYAKHKDLKSHRNISTRSFQLFFLLLGVTICYIVVAPHVYNIIFPKYSNAAFLSQILALSFPAMISIIPTSAFQSSLEENKLYKMLAIESTTSILLLVVMTLNFGVLGAISAKVITRYITTLSNYYYVSK